MPQLASLKTKKTQRVGRGGKRGTTAGRGQKGQKSRSGRKMRPASRDLLLRLPKKRGFRNKPTSDASHEIELKTLAKKFAALAAGGSAKVNAETLKTVGVIRDSVSPKHLKVIGNSAVSIALHLSGIKTTKGAKAAIEKAGGKVE